MCQEYCKRVVQKFICIRHSKIILYTLNAHVILERNLNCINIVTHIGCEQATNKKM